MSPRCEPATGRARSQSSQSSRSWSGIAQSAAIRSFGCQAGRDTKKSQGSKIDRMAVQGFKQVKSYSASGALMMARATGVVTAASVRQRDSHRFIEEGPALFIRGGGTHRLRGGMWRDADRLLSRELRWVRAQMKTGPVPDSLDASALPYPADRNAIVIRQTLRRRRQFRRQHSGTKRL